MICENCDGLGTEPDPSDLYCDDATRICSDCRGEGISLKRLLIFLLGKLNITQKQAIEMYKNERKNL